LQKAGSPGFLPYRKAETGGKIRVVGTAEFQENPAFPGVPDEKGAIRNRERTRQEVHQMPQALVGVYGSIREFDNPG
jgi:hypothetical protein